MTDRRNVRITSVTLLAALLIALVMPLGESGRIIAAILLLPAAAIISFLIKKREISSIHKWQVLLVTTAIALVCVMIYFLSGIKFGFYKNPYGLTSFSNFLKFFLPITVIIVCSEKLRYVLMSQKDKLAHVLCYFSLVVADMLIVSNIPSVTSFNKFMDLIAGSLLPALLSNLLFNYLSKRYGIYPPLVFRLITTLYAYTFSIKSGVEDSIVNFFKLLIPIITFLFIDALYEKKRKRALGNVSKTWRILSAALTVAVIIIMAGSVMLVSNQFKYGSLVIATESMTGELNKGDVILFEEYDKQTIEEGTVIIFEDHGVLVVHRVVEIEIINGSVRYYTKGDANEDNDMGFRTQSDIVGLVSYKLPMVGHVTLWMRSFFKR